MARKIAKQISLIISATSKIFNIFDSHQKYLFGSIFGISIISIIAIIAIII